ncbi:MAG: response regulator [Thermodesulfobacteria bacterium]|nr:response regulator [Thermodesulfobacteriota bacterium]
MVDNGESLAKLIIIDDEPIVGKRLKQVFTKLGYQVETFTNPLVALEYMKSNPFDIVVTDFKMEEMDGMEVLKRARQFNPDARVIIITGYAKPETAKEAFKSGVFDFMVKPFRLEELKEAVQRAAQGKD